METYEGFTIGDEVKLSTTYRHDGKQPTGVVTGFSKSRYGGEQYVDVRWTGKGQPYQGDGGYGPDNLENLSREETLELSKAVVGMITNKNGNAIAIKVTEEGFKMALLDSVVVPSVTKAQFSITKEEAPEFINKLKGILGVT